MKDSQHYKEIVSFIDQLAIVDTHEHLPQERTRIISKVDVLSAFFPHYASSDLVSAGMSQQDLEEIHNPRLPLEERWEKFAPFWEKIQNTGYAQALNLAAKGLYGVDGINEDTYLKLTEKIRKSNVKGLYNWVLKEKSRIDVSILDSLDVRVEEIDRHFFAPVKRFDEFILIKDRSDLESLGRSLGTTIHSLQDLVKSLELEFERLSSLIVGVKIALAYSRTLQFEKVTFEGAERTFNKIYALRGFRRTTLNGRRMTLPEGISFEEAKPLQDFMVHKVIQLAAKHRLPIQIHTGLQEGNENVITNSKPTHLINLFTEYKEAKFDLFHGSYPYIEELAVLSKSFPNVYADLCWLHIISPSAARHALSYMLDTVPSNKIMGFGGDYLFVEGVYGHLVLAKENIAEVLTEKVEREIFSLEYAKIIAKRLLRDNPQELFHLKNYR